MNTPKRFMKSYKPGQKFGQLTLKENLGHNKAGRIQWLCLCESCGDYTTVTQSNLGRQRGCSCRKGLPKHGFSKTPTHSAWVGMIQRCTNPNSPSYRDYGERGISVCWRWRSSFVNFLEDMGERPFDKDCLDRLDSNQGYKPSNCQWATMAEQAGNHRGVRLLTLDGKTQYLAKWAREYGLKYMTLSRRLSAGWSLADALEIPVSNHHRYKHYQGKS